MLEMANKRSYDQLIMIAISPMRVCCQSEASFHATGVELDTFGNFLRSVVRTFWRGTSSLSRPGISGSTQTWVRLALNETNPGVFQIIF